MKKLFVALALTIAAATVAPASADVGISIRVGEPRFYGQLDIGDRYYGRPHYGYRRYYGPRYGYYRPYPYYGYPYGYYRPGIAFGFGPFGFRAF